MTDPTPWTAADGVAVAAVLKAVADPNRLALLVAVAHAEGGSLCVCDLPDLGLAQPTVSHHLKRLRAAGLLAAQRRGTWVHYCPTTSGRALLTALEMVRTSTTQQDAPSG